jgi:hypothetical protein
MVISLMLPGCYRNWDELDAFTKQITCHTTKSQAIALAQEYNTNVEWDEEYRVLSISKEQDAIAIQFIPETFGAKTIRLDTVSAVKSHITYLGLDRLQGDIYLILRCNKPST